MEQEYVVCSALRAVPFAKPTIEAITQRRSRIESHANMLLTLVLLRWYESGKPFTEEVVSQTTVNAGASVLQSRGWYAEASEVQKTRIPRRPKRRTSRPKHPATDHVDLRKRYWTH